MAKAPPRETVGKTICLHRHCNEVATVKRDTGGYLFMACPTCKTVNNRTAAYQKALADGMAAYSASQEKPADPPAITEQPIEQPPVKSGGLLGGLSIFS